MELTPEQIKGLLLHEKEERCKRVKEKWEQKKKEKLELKKKK